MGQLEDILKHQNMVRNNIMKSFGAETSEDSLEKSFEDEVNPFEMEAYKSELTKAELDEFEKAKHQDGDMHPNGKWVWRQSANGGKGDWRVAKKGSSSTSGGSGSAGSTGPLNTSSSYFSKLSNSLIEKYSKKKESVSLSDIEEFYEDFLRDRGQEPTRKVYANEAKKTYDAIVGNWNKKSSNTVTHDINGTKVTVTKNNDGSYTLEANGKKVKSDDPSFFVNGTNLKPRVKDALAKEVGLQTKKQILSQNDKTSIRSIVKKMFPRSNVSFSTKDELIVEVEGKAYGDSYAVWKEWKLKDGEPTEGGYSGDTSKSRIDDLMKKLGKENLKKLKRISLKESYD